MAQRFLKALYSLHSWLGLVLGLALYAICFSGTVALFATELGPWQRGTAHAIPAVAADLSGVDRAIAALLDRSDGPLPQVAVELPGRYRAHAVLQVAPAGGGPPDIRPVDPATGAPLAVAEGAGAAILTELHTDLLLPGPWGRYLVGLLGIAMLVSLLSGILLHRKILQDLFAFRLGRSLRLAWSDAHRSLGLWGLPFHLMMALTGAMLGFVGLALAIGATAAFDGDRAAAFAALGDSPARLTGTTAPPLPLAQLLAAAGAALPGLEPVRVEIRQAGDAGATATVMGTLPGRLVFYPYAVLEAATGATLAAVDWSAASPGRQVYGAVTPLHYGSYGRLALKLLYAVLGAGACLLVLSGLKIWLSRHAGTATGGPGFARRLTTGTVGGLALATAGLFAAGRALPSAIAQDPAAMAWLFLALWLAAGAWPWCRVAAQAGRHLAAGTGLLLLALPVLTFLATGTHLAAAVAAGALPLALVDLAAGLAGLALLWPAARRLLSAARRARAAPSR